MKGEEKIGGFRIELVLQVSFCFAMILFEYKRSSRSYIGKIENTNPKIEQKRNNKNSRD